MPPRRKKARRQEPSVLQAHDTADELLEKGNVREAVQLLKPLADSGNGYTQLKLGNILLTHKQQHAHPCKYLSQEAQGYLYLSRGVVTTLSLLTGVESSYLGVQGWRTS